MSFESDLLRATMQETVQVKQLTAALTDLQRSAAAASQATKNFVASAGGSAWDTFTGSLKLVSMQLARLFIPALIAAAGVAQDFAGWLEDLNPETANAIKEFVKVAAAAAAVYIAIQVMTNPMVLLGVAVIAAVVALKMIPDIINWINNELKKKAPAIGLFPEITSMAWKNFWNNTTAGGALKVAGLGVGAAGAAAGAAPGMLGAGLNFAGFDTESFSRMIKESFAKATGIGTGGLADAFARLFGAGGPELTTRKRRQTLFDFPVEMQARFSAVEEARRQFQIGALKSPLEQEFMRLNRQMAQEAIQETTKRRQAWDVLADIKSWIGLG